MTNLIIMINVFAFFYLTIIASIRFLQLMTVMNRARKQSKRKIVRENPKPITIIMPAYNESVIIKETVTNMLNLDYPNYKLLVINDGSQDNTLDVLKNEFDLYKSDKVYEEQIKSEKVLGIYESKLHKNLVVMDKENGGKASSQNAGINFIDTELFLIIDADSILEDDALWKICEPFKEDENTVGVGGMIQILNGSELTEDSKIKKVKLTNKSLPRFQVLEYLNAFLAGRIFFDGRNIMLLISGAFGAFKKDVAIKAGGYKKGSLGEDFDFTMRLHKYCKRNMSVYKIRQITDVVCMTQVPETFKDLRNQRIRWGRGLLEVLLDNLCILNPFSYGRVTLGILYYWFYEFLAPVIELIGYIAIIIAYLIGILNIKYAIILALVYFLYSSIISLLTLIFKSIFFNEKKYFTKKDTLILSIYCFLDAFGYRQLNSIYKLIAILVYKTKPKWTSIQRKELK